MTPLPGKHFAVEAGSPVNPASNANRGSSMLAIDCRPARHKLPSHAVIKVSNLWSCRIDFAGLVAVCTCVAVRTMEAGSSRATAVLELPWETDGMFPTRSHRLLDAILSCFYH